jgi:hypothetical protein
MKTCKGCGGTAPTFLTSTPDGGEWPTELLRGEIPRGWAPEPVWALWRRESFCLSQSSNRRSYSPQPTNVSTALPFRVTEQTSFSSAVSEQLQNAMCGGTQRHFLVITYHRRRKHFASYEPKLRLMNEPNRRLSRLS